MSDDLRSSNLTFQILSKAQREGYGILAQSWYISFDLCAIPQAERMYSYDAQSAIALVRAAERNRSPAILQLFPVTLAYGKGPFLQFCLNVYVQLRRMPDGFVPNDCIIALIRLLCLSQSISTMRQILSTLSLPSASLNRVSHLTV